MWTDIKLIVAVVLVPTAVAVNGLSKLPCDVSKLDAVDVFKILNGTLFKAVSTHEENESKSGVVVRYEQQDPNTLIVKKRIYIQTPSVFECRPGIKFSPHVTKHGFERKNYKIWIIAHSDNHIALMYATKTMKSSFLFIHARNFKRPLKMTDIDSAMLQKIGERCGKRATTLDFYTRKYRPLPTASKYCSIL